MRLLLSMLLISAFSGCAHSVHQVQVSDFDPFVQIEDGEVVRAQAEQFVIFGFVGQTDYVDQAYSKIQDQCPQGRLTGLTTQFSTSLGFFSWTNKILIQGLCLKSGS